MQDQLAALHGVLVGVAKIDEHGNDPATEVEVPGPRVVEVPLQNVGAYRKFVRGVDRLAICGRCLSSRVSR